MVSIGMCVVCVARAFPKSRVIVSRRTGRQRRNKGGETAGGELDGGLRRGTVGGGRSVGSCVGFVVAIVMVDPVGGGSACVGFRRLFADEFELETACAGEDAVTLELLTAAANASPLRSFALLCLRLCVFVIDGLVCSLFGLGESHLVVGRGREALVRWCAGRARSTCRIVKVAEDRAFVRRFGVRHVGKWMCVLYLRRAKLGGHKHASEGDSCIRCTWRRQVIRKRSMKANRASRSECAWLVLQS